MDYSIKNELNNKCYSIALSFYQLLKDAKDVYNADYYEKLNSYEGLFSKYKEEFTKVFKDAEEKRQSLGDETLYNVPIKDILKTLEDHGFIFDKDTFSEYARGFNFSGYLNDVTYYHRLKDRDMTRSVNKFFYYLKISKNINSVYRFLKSLADRVLDNNCDTYFGRETDEIIETMIIFTEILEKFNDLDKKIEMNSDIVFYGKPLKIILNDLRKLGLIIDKGSVGLKIYEDLDIDIYDHIKAIIDMTGDFLIVVKDSFTRPLHKEARKSLDKEAKKLILCKHMPSLYKLIL